jgi:hypothetical protein
MSICKFWECDHNAGGGCLSEFRHTRPAHKPDTTKEARSARATGCLSAKQATTGVETTVHSSPLPVRNTYDEWRCPYCLFDFWSKDTAEWHMKHLCKERKRHK